MNASEFRIGNLFQDKDGNILSCFGVAPNDDTDKFVIWYSNELGFYLEEDEVFPVKLDWEILLSSGFDNWGNVKCNEFEYYDRFVLHNVVDGTSNFEVHLVTCKYGGDTQPFWRFSIDQDDHIYMIKDPEYVHQLQNAFYLALGYDIHIKTN